MLFLSASTAFHAQELGFRTILVDDCSRGIDLANISSCFEKIKLEGGCVVQSSEVKAMVQGRDRRAELGMTLARHCRPLTSSDKQNNN